MKYSNSALTTFASLAVTSVSAQLQVGSTAMTAANTFDDSDKCPGPLRNDKGCRCIPVEDYDDLRGAILRMGDGDCKCFEPFSVQKHPDEPEISIEDTRRLQLFCQEFGQCEINGPGTHLTIEGEMASATISGFRFIGATESAVIIKDGTGTGRKETREQVFCDNEFVNNENNWSDGGAIKVGTGAKIYVGNSYFEGNAAERMGGAISGTASILQVLDSSFRSNIAKLGGAIATNLPEAQLVLGGCEFDANDAIMGPKYGPAVAANGLVEDLGENDAQPEELMCLDCELTSGIRIREPEPQAQPVEDINVPMPMDEPLPSAAPLDTEGMGALLPTDDEDAAPLVVVEEDAEAYIKEITDVAEENTEEVTADNKCVQCTNMPTKYMLQTGLECATYTYAFERRCGTEYGWWGRDGNLEYCQYSCWKNGAPHMTQGDLPCCERADADDEVVIMETLVEKDAVLAEIENETKEVEATVAEEDVGNEANAEPEQAAVVEESSEETVEEVNEEVTEEAIEETIDETVEEVTEEITQEATQEATEDVVVTEEMNEEATEHVVLGEIKNEGAVDDVVIDDQASTNSVEEESVEEAGYENDEEKETEEQTDNV